MRSLSRTGAYFCHSSKDCLKNCIRNFGWGQFDKLSSTYLFILLTISILWVALFIFICFSSSKYSLHGSQALFVNSLNLFHCSFDAGLLDKSSSCHLVWTSWIKCACFFGLSRGDSIIVDISFINSSLFGLVAKDDISSKYLDWLIAKLILCLSLFGILSNSLDFVITSLTFFWATFIEPFENKDSASSNCLNKSWLVFTLISFEVYNYTKWKNEF